VFSLVGTVGMALGEQPDRERRLLPVGPGVRADDVVVEHPLDVHVLLLGHLGEVRGAVEVLLLSGHGDELHVISSLHRGLRDGSAHTMATRP
jgi:hypothetical protein